jgi:uncharacterized membrane protein YcjF (UPF0283 family)
MTSFLVKHGQIWSNMVRKRWSKKMVKKPGKKTWSKNMVSAYMVWMVVVCRHANAHCTWNMSCRQQSDLLLFVVFAVAVFAVVVAFVVVVAVLRLKMMRMRTLLHAAATKQQQHHHYSYYHRRHHCHHHCHHHRHHHWIPFGQ